MIGENLYFEDKQIIKCCSPNLEICVYPKKVRPWISKNARHWEKSTIAHKFRFEVNYTHDEYKVWLRPKTSWNFNLSVGVNFWSTVIAERHFDIKYCFFLVLKFFSSALLQICGKECFICKLLIYGKSWFIQMLIMAILTLTKEKRQQWPCYSGANGKWRIKQQSKISKYLNNPMHLKQMASYEIKDITD